MRVTIKDVAEAAGVSIATVSRVINKSGYVSPEAQKKVAQAIKNAGYVVKQKPQRAAAGASKIKVIFPTISNPFYAEFYENLLNDFSQQGYEAQLVLGGQVDELGYYLKELDYGQVAGLIVSSPLLVAGTRDLAQLPVVSFDQDLGSATLIRSNNLDGGYRIAQKVLSLGAAKILIISGSKADFYPINDRIKGMLAVFNHYQVDVQTAYLDFSSSAMAKKIQIAKIIQKEAFDAICCTEDVTALMVQQYTSHLDQRPIITGFDGTSLLTDLFPDLITIKQPLRDISKLITEILISKISHPRKKLEPEYIFPVTLIN